MTENSDRILELKGSYDNAINAIHAKRDSMMSDKENINPYVINTPTFDNIPKTPLRDVSTSRGSPACSTCVGTAKRNASLDTLSGFSLEQTNERLKQQLNKIERRLKYDTPEKPLIRNTSQNEIHVEVHDLPFDPNFVNVKQAEEVASSAELCLSNNKPKLKWCANCKASVATYVVSKPSRKTFISSLAICLIGGWCGCCVIPFYMDWGKLKSRVCNRCHKLVA